MSNTEDTKTGIIREYDFGIYMELPTAKSLAQFLNTKISELETALTKLEKNVDKPKHKTK